MNNKDRLLFKDKETGVIYEGLRHKTTSLTSQIIGMENCGYEYLGPVTHIAYGTSLNEMTISDLLELIEFKNEDFDCDFRLTIENGKIRRYSCYGTRLNEMTIFDLLELIEFENEDFNCDSRLTIENGKITRYSCTYQGGD